MDKNAVVYVPGHTGLVGSAVVKRLKRDGHNNILLHSHRELDLLDTRAVKDFFNAERPRYVIDCAAKVGGIEANVKHHAEFFHENVQIQNNLMWAAKEAGVSKFLFVSSAVVYPNICPQPMKEEYVMQGEPDPTKAGYAHAKIAGIKFCEFIYNEFGMKFISCVPTNLYGVGDNFDPGRSHVIPALIQRMHEAKQADAPEVVIWGSGNSRREFLYVEDLVDAIVWLMNSYEEKEFVNVGTGEDVSIKELSGMIKDLTGYKGKLVFDATKPEGTPRRLFDTSKLAAAGWHYQVSLEEGLKRTYDYYLEAIVKH